MMDRARPEMIDSQKNLEICFSDTGARGFRNEFIMMFARAIFWGTITFPYNFAKSFWQED